MWRNLGIQTDCVLTELKVLTLAGSEALQTQLLPFSAVPLFSLKWIHSSRWSAIISHLDLAWEHPFTTLGIETNGIVFRPGSRVLVLRFWLKVLDLPAAESCTQRISDSFPSPEVPCFASITSLTTEQKYTAYYLHPRPPPTPTPSA